MVKIVPYLAVNNGKAAIETYQKVFSAELVSHSPFSPEVGESMGLPKDFDYENSTMHAELTLSGEKFYLSDNPAGATQGGNVEVLIEVESKAEIDNIYSKVESEGLEVIMPLEKQFWGAWYARFKDPHGISWQVNFQEDAQPS